MNHSQQTTHLRDHGSLDLPSVSNMRASTQINERTTPTQEEVSRTETLTATCSPIHSSGGCGDALVENPALKLVVL